jgi:hypothetical protein
MTVASTITIERAEESDLPALLALLSDCQFTCDSDPVNNGEGDPASNGERDPQK